MPAKPKAKAPAKPKVKLPPKSPKVASASKPNAPDSVPGPKAPRGRPKKVRRRMMCYLHGERVLSVF